jgi:hypothetical protein
MSTPFKQSDLLGDNINENVFDTEESLTIDKDIPQSTVDIYPSFKSNIESNVLKSNKIEKIDNNMITLNVDVRESLNNICDGESTERNFEIPKIPGKIPIALYIKEVGNTFPVGQIGLRISERNKSDEFFKRVKYAPSEKSQNLKHEDFINYTLIAKEGKHKMNIGLVATEYDKHKDAFNLIQSLLIPFKKDSGFDWSGLQILPGLKKEDDKFKQDPERMTINNNSQLLVILKDSNIQNAYKEKFGKIYSAVEDSSSTFKTKDLEKTTDNLINLYQGLKLAEEYTITLKNTGGPLTDLKKRISNDNEISSYIGDNKYSLWIDFAVKYEDIKK